MIRLTLVGFICGCVAAGSASAAAAEKVPLSAGFAKVDVTPSEPVRLSGYAARSSSMEGVDGPIYARAAAFQWGDDAPLVVIAIDSIGFPGTFSKSVFESLSERLRGDRARLVLTSTHSHTTPQIAEALGNLFPVLPTEAEVAATQRYTEMLQSRVIEAANQAIASLKPARLFVGQGEATFARNRRGVVMNANGEAVPGPVDHSVPVLKITDLDGTTLRGLMFNYACHCTTFGPEHNRLNGDWAEYATSHLESAHPGVVALCTIGCGADANPHREGPNQMELSQQQGRELSDEVDRVAGSELREITAAPKAAFAYAGLPIDRPTVADLTERLKSGDPNVRRHAETMLDIHQRMGRLPETYPMPIQVWRFGDEFIAVFLGGEVVVDYAFRIKRELATGPEKPAADEDASNPSATALVQPPVWVTAYANDVFGYVASERVRGEGGYEVDSSMIYYSQPGRWSSGTEEVVMRRVHELADGTVNERALSVDEALKTFTLPADFTIEAIASEPLIADPINFALGPDGRLWVVEMGDYPEGTDGKGRSGGRIRVLKDTDDDGRFDAATTFLDHLAFPTGVWPWRDGAIVSGAPDVFFARDVNGDGVADERETLYSGFVESNPQHRISGFAYGLDGWLYLSSGETSHEILSHKTGETLDMAGRDLRIDPDSGRFETVSGKSQYGRVRDDFNNWFGNNNSEPLYHYVIDDGDLRRNPYVASPSPIHHLTDPPAIPPVYPTSRTLDRFNDLWAANRFTSACSPLIVRDDRMPPDVQGAALICEPVHNLVSRLLLETEGMSFKGFRSPSEQTSEFLSSTDGWFRPVRVMAAPDGSLWIADMYRRVIEHPEWIPEAWQAQLNVRDGEDRGRIYRVSRKDSPASPRIDLARMSTLQLVDALRSPSGWMRDSAQQLLLEHRDASAPQLISKLLQAELSPACRVQAMWALSLLAPGEPRQFLPFLTNVDARVRRNAVRIAGENEPKDAEVRAAILRLANDDSPTVRYELALVLGGWSSNEAGTTLATMAAADIEDPWMRAAVLSSASGCAEKVLGKVLQTKSEFEGRNRFVAQLVATALGDDSEAGAARILRLLEGPAATDESWRFAALGACLNGLERNQTSLVQLTSSRSADVRDALVVVRPLFDAARKIAIDETAPSDRRCQAVAILGRGLDHQDEDVEILASLLSPQQSREVQAASVTALAETQPDDLPQRLLQNWKSLEPDVHADILNALFSREGWTLALLDAIEQGQVHAAELDAASSRRLSEHEVAGIRERAATLLTPPAERKEVLERYGEVAGLRGDSSHGTKIFEKHCGVCHRVHDRGNDIGARLAALQDKSTDHLLVSILDPNRAVEGKYLNYAAAMKDGRTFSGLIQEETATSLTLIESNGKRNVLLRIDLEDLASSGKSFMPEGLEKELSLQDVADVISFLQAESIP